MGLWNHVKTAFLLGALTGLLLLAGSFFGGRMGLFIGFWLSLVINIGSYWYSDKIVLRLYRAKEATVSKYPRLHQIVNEVANKAKLPKPRVFVIPSSNPNAFATGRNPKHAVVAVTEGTLELLSERELKGVIAHEMAHVKNKDILISSVAAVIASLIGVLAFAARWAGIFGGFGGNRDGPNFLELIVLAFVAPIVATVLRLAISRSREFLADETGAKFIQDSEGLSSALKKLEQSATSKPMRLGSQNTAHMFIVNPFRKGAFVNLFSTHPTTSQRIEKLESLAF